MSKLFEEIFKSLIFINGIMALSLVSFKIFIKLWFCIWNTKKDNDTFEKRWEDCE